MPFPTVTLKKMFASKDDALLSKYAEYELGAENKAKGERGIVVLSSNGDDPILAPTEEYFTGEKKTANQSKGLANVVGLYQAEQAHLMKMYTGRIVKVDVLFDVDSPESVEEDLPVSRSQ